MGELLYFKNCEERKKAEELLKKYWVLSELWV